MTNNKTISRSQLFKLVWETPLFKLSNDLGISDRAIAKKCKKYNIPTPGIGYWNKLQAGHKLKKKTLPSMENNEDPIVLEIREKQPDPPLSDEVMQAIAFEKEAVNIIDVDLGSDLSHPLIIRLRNSLRKKKSKEGLIYSKYGWVECLSVTDESLNRALHILDALFISLGARGHKIQLEDKERFKISAHIFGEKTNIRLFEYVKQERIYDANDYFRKLKFTPTGLLRLEYQNDFIKGLISDTQKNKRLEKSLNEAIIKLLKASELVKNRRIEKIESEKRWELQRRQWDEERRREEIESRREKLISTVSNKWSDIKKFQKFIQCVKDKMPLYNLSSDQIEKFEEIIKWTEDYIKKNNTVQLVASIMNKF